MHETTDDLELEVRRLPGVVAVGLDDTGPQLRVAVFLARDTDADLIRQRVELLALAHDPQPVVVTVDDHVTQTITLD